MPTLEKGGKMITQHNEIAEIFAEYYTKISKNPHIKSNQRKYTRRKKTKRLTIQRTIYRERTKSNHKTTEKHISRWRQHTSSDDKKPPPETLKYQLELYNKIWEEGIVPEGWKSVTITPLLKDLKYVISYRPVVLTSIFCKIFERTQNNTGLVSV